VTAIAPHWWVVTPTAQPRFYRWLSRDQLTYE